MDQVKEKNRQQKNKDKKNNPNILHSSKGTRQKEKLLSKKK
jgi:hypothetical protein